MGVSIGVSSQTGDEMPKEDQQHRGRKKEKTTK